MLLAFTALVGYVAGNLGASVWNVLVANANLSDQTAYNIVKTIFDRKEDMIKVHAESRHFEYKYQTNTASPVRNIATCLRSNEPLPEPVRMPLSG